MRLVSTAENLADPVRELLGVDQPLGLYDLSLSFDLFVFVRVELLSLLG